MSIITDHNPRASIIFNNILIVCVGNVCRSVTAERILKSKLHSVNIYSAGIGALVGRGVEKKAAEILDTHGYNSKNHLAQQLNSELVMQSDLVLVMEIEQRKFIIKKYPQASGKVFLLGKWNDELEIADPYKKSTEVFVAIFNKIEESCNCWYERLNK